MWVRQLAEKIQKPMLFFSVSFSSSEPFWVNFSFSTATARWSLIIHYFSLNLSWITFMKCLWNVNENAMNLLLEILKSRIFIHKKKVDEFSWIYSSALKIEGGGEGYCFCPVCHSVFNLAYDFWTVSARALIFHMNIPRDKTFPWATIFFILYSEW